MKVTKKCEYAIRCLIDMSVYENGTPLSVETISQRQEISIKYLSTILTELKKLGVVKSKKGPHGGYLLAKSLNDILFQDIIDFVDGKERYEIEFHSIQQKEVAYTHQVLKVSLDEIEGAKQKAMKKLTLLELKTRYLKLAEGDNNYSI